MQSFLKFRGQRKATKPGKCIFFFCVNLLTIAHLRDRVRALALSAAAWVNQEAKTRVYHALQCPRLGEKAEPRNLVFLAVFWQAAAPKLPMVVPHPLPSCPHYQSDLMLPFPVFTASLALFLACCAASVDTQIRTASHLHSPSSSAAWSFGDLVCLIHLSHPPTESN